MIIGVHYFKKAKTIITDNKIIQTIYGFPYSKNTELTYINDISEIEIKQSSIERMLGCGNIYIKGYSNSNYSKTEFYIYIKGVDSVSSVKADIIQEFKVKR